MQPDDDASTGSRAESEEDLPAWAKLSDSARRIYDLDQVEQAVARLLHLSGCIVASLHPDPIESFTTRKVEVELDDDDDDEEQASKKPKTDFERYCEEYFTTLNDIQLALRASIRELRLTRALPSLLTDPQLSVPGGAGASLGVGGKDVQLSRTTSSPDELSLAALEAQKEAWQDLADVFKTIRAANHEMDTS